VGNITNSLLGFVARTIFIYCLGTVYLGVNGLFTNILGMLSFAELGIGSAISFSLYKPLAEKDEKKIQQIINFYRTAYRIIAIVVSIIGISLIPFLKYIVKGADGIDNITLIYCIFLFNTVTSYLITYKTTLLSADQRNYLITNINTVVKIITVVAQSVLLVIFKNFYVYLISNAVIQLASKFYLNAFTDKMYPYVRGKNEERLPSEDKKVIIRKVKALIVHKVGGVLIHQTDNIITSVFINVVAVGLVSNFTMLISMVNNFINSFLASSVAGLGNIIATESYEKRLGIFKNYEFLGFWTVGVSTVCMYFLLSPFISLWIGADKLVDSITVMLLCANYYLDGMRVPLFNIKCAAGVYEQDSWIPIAQAIVNITVSVAAAKYLGLKGVYIGTLISGMIPNIARPFIVCKHVFNKGVKQYFIEYFKRIVVVAGVIAVLTAVFNFITIENEILLFAVKAIICFAAANIVIALVYRKSDEFLYVKQTVRKVIRRGSDAD
jgi:O-antigen/teichoic acid export membrane protein